MYAELEKKMDDGVKKYGKFDPLTDERELAVETQEEVYDVINYSIMDREKIVLTKNPRNSFTFQILQLISENIDLATQICQNCEEILRLKKRYE